MYGVPVNKKAFFKKHVNLKSLFKQHCYVTFLKHFFESSYKPPTPTAGYKLLHYFINPPKTPHKVVYAQGL